MTADQRRLLGTVLIWLGVLAWIPFLILLANDYQLSIFPFLGAHLAGVLVGARLRRSADGMEGIDRSRETFGRTRKIISTVLIYLGVLAWAPYFYLDRVLAIDPVITPFLAAHLTGVLGGAALRASVEVQRFRQRG